jgi:hypothetical protein
VEKQPASLLKVRFANLSELQNHLHVVDGRTVFFFREAAARLHGGERVVVEFSLATSEQVSTLRGSALGRVETAEGGHTGAWIEFPDAKLAKRLERGAEAIATRQHQRLACDLLVEVRQGRRPFLARMMDVSIGGARLLGATAVRVGATPIRPGTAVGLRVVGAQLPVPADLGRADVVRVDLNTGELAVRWVRSDPVVRAASMKLIDAIRGSWEQAQQMVHGPPCCRMGRANDPPMPTMKRRL